MDLSGAILTQHALDQMAKRQIAEDAVRAVLAAPEEVLSDRPGRVVAQSLVEGYLLRIFVDVDREPAEIVTVYRTSNLTKYRRQP
jgi:hypothetical protein